MSWLSDAFSGNSFMPGSTYTPAEALLTPSAAFGKPSQEERKITTEALTEALRLPRELWETGETLRGDTTGMLENFMSGNFDFASHPAFAGQKSAIEDVYGSARDQLIATTPTGGTMTDALGGLEQSKARDLTKTLSDIQNDLLTKAYGVAYGTPGAAIGGLNQAAGNMTNYMAAQQANASQNAAGIGALIAALVA